jgi:hypothetical protein
LKKLAFGRKKMSVSIPFKLLSLAPLLLLGITFVLTDTVHAKIIIDKPPTASVDVIYSRSFGGNPETLGLVPYLRGCATGVLLRYHFLLDAT